MADDPFLEIAGQLQELEDVSGLGLDDLPDDMGAFEASLEEAIRTKDVGQFESGQQQSQQQRPQKAPYAVGLGFF